MDRLVRTQAFSFAVTLAQFALVYWLMERYNLEREPFRNVVALCVAGFAVNFWLPLRFRMWWFLALCLIGLVLVFGMDKGAWSADQALRRCGWLVGIVGGIIGLCALPIAFWWRTGLVALVCGLLAVLRAGKAEWLPAFVPTWAVAVPPEIWPILGSMLMFRLIVYLYDLRFSGRPGLAASGGYLLMLPNVCFPLFPVVDFKTFVKSQQAGATFSSYQVGLGWIVRGVFQLLLYRLAYYEFYLDPARVADGADVAQFLFATYFLYLRVSGSFHVIIGLLRMLGFALPETHHRYYLATSFTDYWRRINIYWKDFIMKLVYYPIMFRLKRAPQTTAMVTATLVAFFATWALHSYQQFWLLGKFPIETRDIVFWGVLALFVTVNSVWEARRGRKRTLGNKKPTVREVVIRGLQAAGTFGLICFLWSIWNSRGMDDWLAVMANADLTTAAYVALALLVIFIFAIIPAPSWLSAMDTGADRNSVTATPRTLRFGVFATVLPAVILIALSTGKAERLLGPQVAGLVRLVKAEEKPSEGDIEVLERGYYEELMDVGLVNSPLSEVFMKRPADWKRLEQTPALRLSGDYRFRELNPSTETVVNGILYRINEHGMRDGPVPIEKPAGTVRVACLGASFTMGWGVAAEDTFVERVERALATPGAPRVEMLNFAVNGYSPVCQTVILEKSVARFKPDVVLYASHESDQRWAVNRMARALREGAEMPSPDLDRIAAECDVSRSTSLAAAERRLGKRGADLVALGYRRIVELARAMGATPVWVYVPGLEEGPIAIQRSQQLRALAADAGMLVLDLSGAYGSAKPESLELAPWDRHPNAEGHRLLADRLHRAMLESETIRAALRPSAPPSGSDR